MKKNVNSANSKQPAKQSGGTILGIIIGLVIGLAIAVVVALMITKTSTPFTNKLGITKGADTPAIQLTDPNKPLYGSSAKEIMANANKAPDNATTTDATQQPANPVSPSNTANQVNVAVRPADAVKPDAQKSDGKNARSADQQVAKTGSDDNAPAYYLQVGAFRDATDAEGARAKLALIGVESRVSNGGAEGDNLYRVRIGPFDQLDNMNRMRSKLSENSIDVAVIKTPK